MNTLLATRRFQKRARHRIRAERTQIHLLRRLCKEMPPTQAIVFMSYFNQFPERFVRGNDNYFRPDWATTIRQMKLKRRAYWKMTRALVTLGFLERRRRGLRAEYRIVFEKLDKYAEGGSDAEI
jgi:acyl carrier protein phosphodiesterase